MIIAIDFDGTVVTHEYPKIGSDVGAVPVLKELVAKGHQLILFTMRDGVTLQKAVEWFEARGIPLWGVNENHSQREWTNSPKVYANLYIDDAGLGIPLSYFVDLGDRAVGGIHEQRPFVNWVRVREMLVDRGILK